MTAPRLRDTAHGRLAVRVLKAMLSAGEGNPRPPFALLRAPHLFPFEIALPSTAALEGCGALDIFRHGLDHEILPGLAAASPEPPLSRVPEGRT